MPGEKSAAKRSSRSVTKYTPATRSTVISAPFRKRESPRFNRCSQKEMALPKATTGWGSHAGSPSQWSSSQAVRSGRFKLKATPKSISTSSSIGYSSSSHCPIAFTSLSFSSRLWAAIRKKCSFSPSKLEASRIKIPCSPAR